MINHEVPNSKKLNNDDEDSDFERWMPYNLGATCSFEYSNHFDDESTDVNLLAAQLQKKLTKEQSIKIQNDINRAVIQSSKKKDIIELGVYFKNYFSKEFKLNYESFHISFNDPEIFSFYFFIREEVIDNYSNLSVLPTESYYEELGSQSIRLKSIKPDTEEITNKLVDLEKLRVCIEINTSSTNTSETFLSKKCFEYNL
nr:hypothetical protein [Gaetbulibacter sp. 4G1]